METHEDIGLSQPRPEPPQSLHFQAPAAGVTPSEGQVYMGKPRKQRELLPRPYVLVPVGLYSTM